MTLVENSGHHDTSATGDSCKNSQEIMQKLFNPTSEKIISHFVKNKL